MPPQNEEVKSMADQSLQNQQIIAELSGKHDRRTQEVRIIQDISTEITSTLDLDKILNVILHAMDKVLGFKHAMILLLDDAGEKLKVAANHGYEESGVGAEVVVGQGVFGMVAKSRKMIRMGNIGVSMAYMSAVKARMAAATPQIEPGGADGHETVKLPGLANVQSQIGIPLLAKEQLIGVFAVESSRLNAFDDLDEMLLTVLANQAAISIDNARLYDNLEHRVIERTQELSEKNSALEKTLKRLKDTQNQLIVQEKLAYLGALTAGIAHEIKNPLNFVNNFAELSTELTQELLEEIQDQKENLDAEALEFMEGILSDLQQNTAKINEHGQRANSIVNGMLLHSRDKGGERQPTDINALLAQDIDLTYHGMRANDPSFNVAVETDYDDSIGQIDVVPQDISRVSLNIINNACYAVHQKRKKIDEGFTPTLRVRTKNLGDHVEIRIRDNGAGIPKDVVDKIFNPFFTTKPTGEGTGLGLSISYDILVQEHNGEIRVESEAGSYTEFIITLPKKR